MEVNRQIEFFRKFQHDHPDYSFFRARQEGDIVQIFYPTGSPIKSEPFESFIDPASKMYIPGRLEAWQKFDGITQASKFSYYLKPISNTKPHKEISLFQLVEVIRNPKYFKMQTDKLRSLPADQQPKYKTINFDYVTFSGTFEKRDNKSLKDHSGLICIDLDHLSINGNNPTELKQRFAADPELEPEMIFISPSGDGLKVITGICRDLSHEQNFTAISNYFSEIYKITIDQGCKDIARACFVCYDPEVYLKPIN